MAHSDDKVPSIDHTSANSPAESADGADPSAESAHRTGTLLSDPAVLRLLGTLVNDVPCLTTGQAHGILRGDEPAGCGAHRAHKGARATLSKLKIEGYLGSETVKWLPRATAVAGPIVRLQRHFDHAGDADAELLPHFGTVPTYLCTHQKAPLEVTLPAAEVERLTDFSRSRIPQPQDHRETRFHFATEKARELLESKNLRVGGRRYSDPTLEQVARGMIVRHLQAERGATPSPFELASTTLVGVYNLAQVLFWEPVRRLRAAGRCSFSIVDRNSEFWFNGVLTIEGRPSVSVHYLRPILMHGMRVVVSRWDDEDRSSVFWWV